MPAAPQNITIDHRSKVPLYEQICQHFRAKIEANLLEPGASLPTNHELCEQLQVNYKTAQQAMALLAKEGYVVRQSRRGTTVKGVPRRGVVGIYVWAQLLDHDPRHEYYRLITQQLCGQLEELGRVHRMYLGAETRDSFNIAEEDLLRHFSGGVLSGAVIVNPYSRIDELMEHSRSLRTPVVTFSRPAGMDYSVTFDNIGYMRQAAGYLKRRGCKRVGAIYNGTRHDIDANRIDIAQILADCGVATGPSWIAERDDTLEGGFEEAGYKAAASIPLAELDGLIVNDDIMALGVARRLRELGLDPSRDLEVTTTWNRGSRLELGMPFNRFEFDVATQVRIGLELLQNVIHGQRVSEPHLKVGLMGAEPIRGPGASRAASSS